MHAWYYFSPKCICSLWFSNNREKGKGIYKAEFGMKYGGSRYNICPIVTVFIYIFEQNQSQEEGFCVCVCVCVSACKEKKCFIKL